MNLSSTHTATIDIREAIRKIPPATLFLTIIFGALLFFEVFNYSTTDYALRDLMGELSFMGLHWSTILAIAFCGIDFAGIARLFTPNSPMSEAKEGWFLFAAWLLAATMNAALTWWGVSMAIVNHTVASTAVIDPNTLTKVVPVFVAIMVWVIRILIIGSFSYAFDRAAGKEKRAVSNSNLKSTVSRPRPISNPLSVSSRPLTPSGYQSRPLPRRPISTMEPAQLTHAEPTYHSMAAAPKENNTSNRQF
ncbi:MAG TPA: hypothetical protein VN376_03765 [Longilinea sp.]|nr:hypothetical protein [Longilinea sp.]